MRHTTAPAGDQQPALALDPAPIDPANPEALRAAYQHIGLWRMGISFQRAIDSPGLRICLRVIAEQLAKRAGPKHP